MENLQDTSEERVQTLCNQGKPGNQSNSHMIKIERPWENWNLIFFEEQIPRSSPETLVWNMIGHGRPCFSYKLDDKKTLFLFFLLFHKKQTNQRWD